MLAVLRARFADAARVAPARTDLAIVEQRARGRHPQAPREKPLVPQPRPYIDPMNAIFLMTARDYAPADDRARDVVARLEKIPAIVAPRRSEPRRPAEGLDAGRHRAARGAKAFFEQRAVPRAASRRGQAAVDQALTRRAQKAYADYKQFLEKTSCRARAARLRGGAPSSSTSSCTRTSSSTRTPTRSTRWASASSRRPMRR